MSLNTYVTGTRCWFTDDKEGWISADLSTKDVTDDGKVTMTFVDESGKVCPHANNSLHIAHRALLVAPNTDCFCGYRTMSSHPRWPRSRSLATKSSLLCATHLSLKAQRI